MRGAGLLAAHPSSFAPIDGEGITVAEALDDHVQHDGTSPGVMLRYSSTFRGEPAREPLAGLSRIRLASTRVPQRVGLAGRATLQALP